MTHVLAVLVRAVVVAVAAVAAGFLMNIGVDEGGANIGAGLVAFLVIAVISLAWSFTDGRRWRSMGRALAVWAAVAVLVAVAMVLQIQLQGSGIDPEVLRSDMMTVAPMLFGLVLIPAAIGSVIGALTNRSGGSSAQSGQADT